MRDHQFFSDENIFVEFIYIYIYKGACIFPLLNILYINRIISRSVLYVY